MNFCPACGTRYLSQLWPRNCHRCHKVQYQNPTPVAVAVVPVCDAGGQMVGIMGVLRGKNTGKGAQQWALPGGFLDKGEDACVAAMRELREETALVVDPDRCHLLTSAPSSDGSCVLLFVLAPPISTQRAASAVPAPEECLAVGLLDPLTPLAFPTHARVVADTFNAVKCPP